MPRKPSDSGRFFPLTGWLSAETLQRASIQQVERPGGAGKFVVRSAVIVNHVGGRWECGFPSGAVDLAAGSSRELQRFGIRYPGAED